MIPQFHGIIKDRRLKITDRRFFIHLRSFEDGQKVFVSMKRWRRVRTDRQNRYYWSVVLPVFGSHLGYEPAELHEELKAKFLPRESKLEPGNTLGGSTKELNINEFTEYIEKVKRFAAVEFGCYIPDPYEVGY